MKQKRRVVVGDVLEGRIACWSGMIWNADGIMIWNDLHADSMVSGTVLILNDITYFKNKYLFIYFGLCWVFIAASRLLSSHREQDFQNGGFSGCRVQALGEWAQSLWCTGLAAPWHVESSWTKDWTSVPCIGRWTPIHCTTRDVQDLSFFMSYSFSVFFLVVDFSP